MRRPATDEIPDAPGAYLFRDRHGAVLYVGKAKSLKKRVGTYFSRDLSSRTQMMVDTADSVDVILTDNEVAALMLEYNLIQKHKPRFNIRLRDDKSYPYLALTTSEEWPRATVMRGKRHRGNRYFGPYAHAYAIRQTLDLLLRTFPVRTCTNEKFKRHSATGRPCLLFHIERCSGPCIGAVTPEDYSRHLEGLAEFLSGRSDGVVESLRAEMAEAAESLEYERAARVRDRLAAVEKALSRQEVASTRREDFDVIALEEDDLEAAMVLLAVRNGRVTGRATSIVDKVEDVTTAELIGRMLQLMYGDETPPPEVLVQELPDDAGLWTAWLGERRNAAVGLRVPRRGSKVRLMETARTNAREEFARHRLRRAGDHNARARALRSIQEELDLPEPPLRIEAYDISTIQGRHTVGSMVVMEDGLPKRSQYRRFEIRGVTGQDDFAAMEEMLTRRFRAYLEERERPVEERGKFAYPPALVLVDGGAGQLGRAVKVVSDLGIEVPVAGLAKRMEEVYLPGRPEPVRIPRGRDALYLLQQIRDEAHRFAITYHRTLRGREMVDSALDGVHGLGPMRRQALLKRFGSLKRLGDATVEELGEVVPAAVAEELHRVLHGG
ncbi:MAG: excinuclease ABC subunit UvrC [Acidimicrobiia bacterium]|nr:excinuclease ABC subunit UvrC [Acidimicrobiia bacterium]